MRMIPLQTPSMMEYVKSEHQIIECLPVLLELRAHFSPEELLEAIQLQMRQGYQLVCCRHQGIVSSLAGFRLFSNLARGRFLYVDDLVTRSSCRRLGHGRRLWSWLTEFARSLNCESIHLDSGNQRLGAHEFYQSVGMNFTSRHYSFSLEQKEPE